MARAVRILLVFAFSLTSLWAGSASVRMVDRAGAALVDVQVGLRIGDAAWVHYRARTDGNGVAFFDNLQAGTYHVVPVIGPTSNLVEPDRNPFVEAPRITLLDDTQSAEATIELWRGSRITLELRKNRGDLKYFQVLMTHVETGKIYRAKLDERGYLETVLVPGRWSITLEQPPMGYLLVDIEVDGRSTTGDTAEILLEAYGPTRFVTWHYMAVARIEGTVDVVRGEGLPLVVAELLEPGPWLLAAEQRGASNIRRVRGRYDHDGRSYAMDVPDGRWEVSVFSPDLIHAEPEQVLLQLESGDVGDADFAVEMEDRQGQTPLIVHAEPGPGKWLRNVWIEIWRVDETGRAVERVARMKEEYSPPRFYGLPAADYLAVALHPDFLESYVQIEGYDPDVSQGNKFTIDLDPGGTLEALARDVDGKPVAGVRILVERLDDRPQLVTDDPKFISSKLNPWSSTDASGFLRLKGLYPGLYRATAKLQGEMAATHFVEIFGVHSGLLSVEKKPGAGELYSAIDDPIDEVELELAEAISLDLRVLPAATLQFALACIDGDPLSDSTAVRVFPIGEPHRLRQNDPDLLDGAWLALDGVPLGGVLQDRLLVGPLETDALQIAVRPTGFGLWTWAYGVEQRDDAASFITLIGRNDDVGSIEIECAPSIELLAETGDRGALPDLSLTEFKGEAIPLDAAGEKDGTSYRPRLQVDPSQLLLRNFDVGRVHLVGTLHHPHWLPKSSIELDLDAELEQGQLVPAAFWIPAVGGAVRVFGEVFGARLINLQDPEAEAGSVVKRSEGMILIESVPTGQYRVEACADTLCAKPLQVWDDVRVERGVTTKVRPGE